MRIFLIVTIGLIFNLMFCNVCGAEEVKPAGQPLKLGISLVQGAKYSAKNIPLRITLENTGEKPIRLFKILQPLPAFFNFAVSDKNDNPVGSNGGFANVDFRMADRKYIELESNEVYGITINLFDAISDKYNVPLIIEPGDYQVKVSYSGRYGQDSFKGRVESLPLTITIPPPASEPAKATPPSKSTPPTDATQK